MNNQYQVVKVSHLSSVPLTPLAPITGGFCTLLHLLINPFQSLNTSCSKQVALTPFAPLSPLLALANGTPHLHPLSLWGWGVQGQSDTRMLGPDPPWILKKLKLWLQHVSVEVSPSLTSRTTTPCTCHRITNAFVGPHHAPIFSRSKCTLPTTNVTLTTHQLWTKISW